MFAIRCKNRTRARNIYMCFLFVRAILSVHSSVFSSVHHHRPCLSLRQIAFFSSLSLSLFPTRSRRPPGSRARRPKPAGLPASFVRYFSSGTLARQSYSLVAPHLRARFLPSIWRYTSPSPPRLSLPPIPYSSHVTPDWKMCSTENSPAI